MRWKNVYHRSECPIDLRWWTPIWTPNSRWFWIHKWIFGFDSRHLHHTTILSSSKLSHKYVITHCIQCWMQHLCFHKVPNYPLASYIFGGYNWGYIILKRGTNLNLLLFSNKSLLLKYVYLVVMDKLTELTIRQAKPKLKQYKLFDGGGMFLLVLKIHLCLTACHGIPVYRKN